MNELKKLFFEYKGKEPDTIVALPGAGSNRKYYRLTAGEHASIGVIGTSPEENQAFIQLSRHFKQQNLPVPQVWAVSSDRLHYIVEDLGDNSLFDMIANGRKTACFSEEEQAILHKTISQLADIQFKGAAGLDFSICYPQPEFDRRTVLWDLNYFKYSFLKPSGLEFRENLLEDDFEQLATVLLAGQSDTFLYRDFQSRNVMIRNHEPFFIDFQGGRKGPIYYDLASFLWQAKANFSTGLRESLLQTYWDSLSKYQPTINKAHFKEQLRYFVLFRTLQVLGAYGFRGYIERKAHFIESIPYALQNLKDLLETPCPTAPYLQEVLHQLIEREEQKKQQAAQPDKDILTVTIYSFSYKKGIPEDKSGNGGGYVFDCRAIHNPGRYEQYKQLTGLNQPVIDFLEDDGEITRFLNKIYPLADFHVQRYLDRKFNHLMFSFGCTGGQHRSVYSAQHLADYIRAAYPQVNVVLKHREQDKP